MDATPLVETTALAIAMDLADMAANHPVPKVAETRLQQWETANATAVVIYASVVPAIAKAPVAAVVPRVLQEDNFHFGWGVQLYLPFPTFQTQTTMAKRLTLICLFLLCIVGGKAQQTICYHFYKYIDPVTNISHTMDRYLYFHFQGIYCYITTEKDEELKGNNLYRYEKTTTDHCDSYVYGYLSSIRPRHTYNGIYYNEHGYSYEDGFTVLYSEFTTQQRFLVSNDKSLINWCSDIYIDGITKKGVTKIGKRVSAPPQKPVKPSMIE